MPKIGTKGCHHIIFELQHLILQPILWANGIFQMWEVGSHFHLLPYFRWEERCWRGDIAFDDWELKWIEVWFTQPIFPPCIGLPFQAQRAFTACTLFFANSPPLVWIQQECYHGPSTSGSCAPIDIQTPFHQTHPLAEWNIYLFYLFWFILNSFLIEN